MKLSLNQQKYGKIDTKNGYKFKTCKFKCLELSPFRSKHNCILANSRLGKTVCKCKMAKMTLYTVCHYVNFSEGTGHLVFEFGRVLEYLQSVSRARGQHLFWMFENVASMRADIRDTISECFKVFISPPSPLFPVNGIVNDSVL